MKKKSKTGSNKILLGFFGVIVVGSIVLMILPEHSEGAGNTQLADIEMTDTETEAETEQTTTTPETETETSPTTTTVSSISYEYIDYETGDDEDDEEVYEAEYDEPEEDYDEPKETVAPKVTRTVITSRERHGYDKNSVYIDMQNVLQLPELPVGCEITALTILLRYYGFNADKTDLASNYLPISSGYAEERDGKIYKDSFFDFFIGDPYSRGYGCFSRPIARAAEKYISAHGGGYTVKNISGSDPDTLYNYLINDTPVLCWATDGMIEPEYYETWYDKDTGEQLDWYLNEHAFVLAGFNISAGTVTLNDPMKGIIDYNIDRFETRYSQMHCQAIVIIPDGGSEPAQTTVTAETSAETEPVTETSEQVTESETFIETMPSFEDPAWLFPDTEYTDYIPAETTQFIDPADILGYQ